jgi:hypothetical protein
MRAALYSNDLAHECYSQMQHSQNAGAAPFLVASDRPTAPTPIGKLTEQLPPTGRNIEESVMKKMVLAAFAALGVVLGTASLLTPANAALPTYNNPQASQAGGEG